MQGADFGSNNVTDKGDQETEKGPSVRRRRVHDLSLLDLRCSSRRVMAMQLQDTRRGDANHSGCCVGSSAGSTFPHSV